MACLLVYVADATQKRETANYALLGGVKVGPAGDLIIVSSTDSETGKPDEFIIYAPGQWSRVTASREEE